MNVAINGFGRIGRAALRTLAKANFSWNGTSINIVCINDLADVNTMAHLFKYDSIHGRFTGDISTSDIGLSINGKDIRWIQERDIDAIDWRAHDVDVVLECTGIFRTEEQARKHLTSGAKKVVLSAPPKGGQIPTVVLGINDDIITPDIDIISNASCTTNNAAPLVKILDDTFEIESAYITTVHSYTSDQKLQDAPHPDLRRARAAAESIVPTTTGAAKAITKIFPHLNGKIGGAGIRVPVPDGSLTDLTCILSQETSVAEINDLFKAAAKGNLSPYLEYTEDPIVSRDIIGSHYSCTFDAQLTSVIGKMVKVVGWYDNEMGYSTRLLDLLTKL